MRRRADRGRKAKPVVSSLPTFITSEMTAKNDVDYECPAFPLSRMNLGYKSY